MPCLGTKGKLLAYQFCYKSVSLRLEGKLTKAKEEMVECSGGMTTNEINKKMSVWVREVIDAAKGTMPLTSHAVGNFFKSSELLIHRGFFPFF